MRATRSTGRLVTSVAVVLFLSLVGGCMSPDAGVEDRMQAASDGIFTAMGALDQRLESEYIRRVAESCAIDLGLQPGLGEGQGWYARKNYALREGEYDWDRMFFAARDYLRSQGWQVEEYVDSLEPGPNDKWISRQLIAVKQDLSMRMESPGLTLVASGGPCGATFTKPRDIFKPVS